MSRIHPGVTFWEQDKDKGPFRIRIGGTNDFVSLIDPNYKYNWPPGRVLTCEGWNNDNAMLFNTLEEAVAAADRVWAIEGFHTSIEVGEKWI